MTLKNRYQFISLTIVIIFGFVLFYVGTDGFTAFTEETARTNKLITEKPIVPDVILEDSLAEEYHFKEFEGKYVFMTFFYTSCTTVCPALETNVKRVYDRIPEQYLGKDIVFLSVSFDPERDTPEVLDRYHSNFATDKDNWVMARVKDEHQLDDLLDKLGVIAIEDGEGDFTHNSAFYLVNRDGVLVDVMDYQDINHAESRLNGVLEGQG